MEKNDDKNPSARKWRAGNRKPFDKKISARGVLVNDTGSSDLRENELVVQALIAALEKGIGRKHACVIANIGKTTFYKWLAESEEMDAEGKIDTKAQIFRDLVDVAEAACIKRNLLLIQSAGAKDWRASAWFLERAFPADYAPRERIEHMGEGGGPVATMNVTADAIPDNRINDALERYYAAKAKRRVAE